jgi:hypothetical protein
MLFNAQHAAPGRARRQAAWIAAWENAETVGGHTVGLLGLYVPSRGPQQHRYENKRAF